MLPIVSSIIAGHGIAVSRGRGFALAASLFARNGLGLHRRSASPPGWPAKGWPRALQTPWVLGAFGVALVALALSMFGVYELRLPAAFAIAADERLAAPAGRAPRRRLRDGRHVGPDRQPVRRRAAGRRAGLPEPDARCLARRHRAVLAGGRHERAAAAGRRVGRRACCPGPARGWTRSRRLFGLLLLGVAMWMVQPAAGRAGARAVGQRCALARPCSLACRSGSAAPRLRRAWRGVAAALLAVVGLLQWVGAASGGSDPLQPLSHCRRAARPPSGRHAALHDGPQRRRTRCRRCAPPGDPSMLDFYADWCVSCKEMERFTFTDPAVQREACRRAAAEGRRDAEQRRRPRAVEALRPVRSAGHAVLRSRRAARSTAPRVIGFQSTGAFWRPCVRRGCERPIGVRAVLKSSAQSRGGAVW